MACVVAATGAIMAELLNGDWTGRPKVLLTCATLFTGACTSALFTDAFAALAATPAGAAATVLRKVTCTGQSSKIHIRLETRLDFVCYLAALENLNTSKTTMSRTFHTQDA
eukprot:4139723-Amphidinium_carterae.1